MRPLVVMVVALSLAAGVALAQAADLPAPQESSSAGCGLGPTQLGMTPPPLAYRTAGVPLGAVTWPPIGPDGSTRVAVDGLEATLRRLAGGQWELTVAARGTRIEEVRFPWWPLATLAPGATDDWIFYLSATAGGAASVSDIRGGFRARCDAPGLCVSPILILATANEGLLIAGTTWPPRHLEVIAGAEGFGLLYPGAIATRASVTLRTLVNTACVEPDHGREPWREVLAPYLAWRQQWTIASGLTPSFPDWLVDAEGWFNVQLQNSAAFDAERLETVRQKAKAFFPWIQLWGQMSNYAGPRELAVPPLGLFEHGDCCAVDPSVHRRYLPALAQFIAHAAVEGRVGVYAQPGPDPLFDEAGNPTPGLNALRTWLRKNQALGTNATYIDVLGNRYYGDPLSVARFVRSELPPGTVIELAEDLYPAAYLLSGGLTAGIWDGAPDNSPEARGKAFRHGAFVRLGRYLVGDRIVFLGESNSDGRLWGSQHHYWGERQAFLLGAKFDSMNPFEGDPTKGVVNEAIAAAIEERQRVGWWRRNPVYLDRAGISNCPPDVDVRRFRGRSGEDLLAIDNWDQREGAIFSFEGRSIAVPAKRFSIWLSSMPAQPARLGNRDPYLARKERFSQ